MAKIAKTGKWGAERWEALVASVRPAEPVAAPTAEETNEVEAEARVAA